MKAVQQIATWVRSLPYWEQLAFQKVVAGTPCTESDIETLLAYLLEDKGVEPRTLPRSNIEHETESSVSATSTPVRLASITEIEHVNALVPGQKLTFAYETPGVTVIFGGNASGKSGYARLFGSAGFSRGDKKLLPDITKPLNNTALPKATLELYDGKTLKLVPFAQGVVCDELNSVYVFDSSSIRVHLSDDNVFSFQPAALSVITALADLSDKVRKRLQERIDEKAQAHSFLQSYSGKSRVSEFVASASALTKAEELDQFPAFSEADALRITELDAKIGQLRVLDTKKQVEAQHRVIAALETLENDLRALDTTLAADQVKTVSAVLADYQAAETLRKTTGLAAFAKLEISGIGGPVWQGFLRAARELAKQQHPDNGSYPLNDDHCLFCQQKLTPEATEVIEQFWKYLDAEAEQLFKKSEQAVTAHANRLRALKVDCYSQASLARSYLPERQPALDEMVVRFLQGSGERIAWLLAALERRSMEKEPPAPLSSPHPKVKEVIEQLRKETAELASKDPATEIQGLEEERILLQHRKTFSEQKTDIAAFVERQKWVRKAEKALGTTRHITTKQGELFAELVTQRYIKAFTDTLSLLGRELSVQPATTGKKGATLRHLVLKDVGQGHQKVTPDSVLSEGEKRAVAFADFLAEVAVDESCGCIVLDDPVTSLDAEWKNAMARRLAREGKFRQVIIFTHDLHFLHLLGRHAKDFEVPLEGHWIKRGDDSGKPGYVFLNNSPLTEKDYKNAERAKTFLKSAKEASPQDQETLLQQGFGALRTSYEALVILELFNEVVLRFDERISFGRLEQIVWDQGLCKDIISGCERLSRFIEGHLHSDVHNQVKCTPQDLQSEIAAYELLRKRLKDLKKAGNATGAPFVA